MGKPNTAHFADRTDAGQQLAELLFEYRGEDTVVYALPRGGVAVGVEVARALNAPLDLVITRKIGHPINPEYAVGAVTEDGELLCYERELALLDEDWLRRQAVCEQREAQRRRQVYLNGKASIPAKGKRAIVVDNGVATGLTLRAALRSIRKAAPKELIAAVPVAPQAVIDALMQEADAVVALACLGDGFGAVSAFYDDFEQVDDAQVVALLKRC